jgi:uncharacterized protein YnzC (UPF0291/DUF896 family)
MEMKDIIEKVNYYSKLIKERELTAEESNERAKYRELYLEKFKAQVRGHLDNVKIVDSNDNEIEKNNFNKFKN